MESQPVMDLAAALDRFDGDQDLFLTLTGLFVERSAQALDALQAALAAQDLPVLIKEAHKLKGSAMEFCARPAVAAVGHLEESARKAAVQDLPIWQGDKIFFKLLAEDAPFFHLELTYDGDVLVKAVLDGVSLAL